MPWQMQINLGNEDPPNWVSVSPSGSKTPYEYDTKQEAAHMLDTCYPDQCREDRLGGVPKQTRVIEVIAPKPKYAHDCGACTFLGQSSMGLDLYHCLQMGMHPTVVARFGDGPAEYTSGIPFAGSNPDINEAVVKAKALGLDIGPSPVPADVETTDVLTPEIGFSMGDAPTASSVVDMVLKKLNDLGFVAPELWHVHIDDLKETLLGIKEEIDG